MKVKYIWPQKVSIVVRSKNRYVFTPGEPVEILPENFKDVYDLIRSHIHWEYIIIEPDPDFNNQIKAVRRPGVTTLADAGKTEQIVKIATHKVDWTEEVKKTFKDIKEDVDKLIEKNTNKKKVPTKKTSKKNTAKK